MKTIEKKVLATYKLQSILWVILFFFCSQSFAESFDLDVGSVNLNGMAPPKMEILYPSEATKVGTQVTVQITIPEKWHVNANIPADPFLKPSTLDIQARGIEFGEAIWPEPIKEYSEALDFENLVFKGTFEVKIPVKAIAADYDTSTTNVEFGYQACSQICLAPQTVHAALELKLESKFEESSKKNSHDSLALLLGLAFLGGLILNLMPCVLPVLFLKLFSLVRNAGETRARLWKLTISLVLGILTSFWVLAGIVSLIKAGSGNAGWGFQFQNPGFVAFMVVLLSAFAMNLFGFFEIFLPGSALTKMDAATRKEGLAGAFLSGVLMVLLSTPCSAPFLGTAMGFAFTQSAAILFVFFTVAALGLAFPYILVAIFPKVLKVFPKPGTWMAKFQKVLGIFLLGTAIWLVWVGFQMTGAEGAAIIATFGLCAMLLSVIFGKFARPNKPFIREPIFLLAVTSFLFSAWFLGGKPAVQSVIEAKSRAAAEKTLGEDGWYNYSEANLKALAQEGRPIFIDVTADWCLTCKTNEAVVLSREDVKKVLSDANAILVRADYTLESAEVTNLLRNLGKSGVPAYAVYNPKSQKWNVLSEILTLEDIEDALK